MEGLAGVVLVRQVWTARIFGTPSLPSGLLDINSVSSSLRHLAVIFQNTLFPPQVPKLA